MKLQWLLILAVCCSACTNGFIPTTNNYRVTKNGKFRLRNAFQLKDTSVLSTTGIYQFNCYKDRWFKFYPDGRVLFGFDSDYPQNLNERIIGLAGYYKLEENNLMIELSYTQLGNDWYVLILKGRVAGDTIDFTADHPQGIGRNIRHFTNSEPGCHYLKVYKPDLLLGPDW